MKKGNFVAEKDISTTLISDIITFKIIMLAVHRPLSPNEGCRYSNHALTKDGLDNVLAHNIKFYEVLK